MDQNEKKTIQEEIDKLNRIIQTLELRKKEIESDNIRQSEKYILDEKDRELAKIASKKNDAEQQVETLEKKLKEIIMEQFYKDQEEALEMEREEYEKYLKEEEEAKQKANFEHDDPISKEGWEYDEPYPEENNNTNKAKGYHDTIIIDTIRGPEDNKTNKNQLIRLEINAEQNKLIMHFRDKNGELRSVDGTTAEALVRFDENLRKEFINRYCKENNIGFFKKLKLNRMVDPAVLHAIGQFEYGDKDGYVDTPTYERVYDYIDAMAKKGRMPFLIDYNLQNSKLPSETLSEINKYAKRGMDLEGITATGVKIGLIGRIIKGIKNKVLPNKTETELIEEGEKGLTEQQGEDVRTTDTTKTTEVTTVKLPNGTTITSDEVKKAMDVYNKEDKANQTISKKKKIMVWPLVVGALATMLLPFKVDKNIQNQQVIRNEQAEVYTVTEQISKPDMQNFGNLQGLKTGDKIPLLGGTPYYASSDYKNGSLQGAPTGTISPTGIRTPKEYKLQYVSLINNDGTDESIVDVEYRPGMDVAKFIANAEKNLNFNINNTGRVVGHFGNEGETTGWIDLEEAMKNNPQNVVKYVLEDGNIYYGVKNGQNVILNTENGQVLIPTAKANANSNVIGSDGKTYRVDDIRNVGVQIVHTEPGKERLEIGYDIKELGKNPKKAIAGTILALSAVMTAILNKTKNKEEKKEENEIGGGSRE